MSRTLIALLALPTLVGGCVIGPKLATFGPATTPAGVDVMLQVERTQITGELLAVEDTAVLIVLRTPDGGKTGGPPLVRVPTRKISYVGGTVTMRGRWGNMHTARLRPLARYPQGVTPDLEARLAEAYQAPHVGWMP